MWISQVQVCENTLLGTILIGLAFMIGNIFNLQNICSKIVFVKHKISGHHGLDIVFSYKIIKYLPLILRPNVFLKITNFHKTIIELQDI